MYVRKREHRPNSHHDTYHWCIPVAGIYVVPTEKKQSQQYSSYLQGLSRKTKDRCTAIARTRARKNKNSSKVKPSLRVETRTKQKTVV